MKKVPKLRFKDSNGNDYPDWEEKKLGDIFERITEKNSENNTNVLTISAQHGLISQTDFFNKSVAGKDLSKYYLLRKDDFAYNKSYSNGYPCGAIKKLNKHEKGIVSTLYICFRMKDKNNIVDFFEQFFESKKIDKKIQDIAQEGARNHGLLNISIQDFFDITIYLPISLEEQQKIADFLSSVDKKISLTEEKLELFKKYKKGVMQRIFSQKLRFKDSDGNDYPEWEEKKLGEISEICTGKKDLEDKKDDGIYPFFVRSKNIEKIDTYSYDGEAILIPGDGKIGEVFHYINGKFDYHQRVYKISNFNNMIGKYIYYFLENHFKKHALTYTVKATVDSLRLPIIKEFKIQLPTLEEQQKISDFLSSIDNKIENMERELGGLKKFKKGLFQQMFI